MTDSLPANVPTPDPELIAQAVALLRGGALVGVPTETVYGLGADADNPEAVGRIFDTKGRPRRHPVIVHVADTDPIDAALHGWALEIPETARVLAREFWPGPLTIILPRGPRAHDGVTGGKPTVGLRVPSHPWALALVRAFGGGIAAPSANRFGHVSPTTAQHVREEFGTAVELVLDGGPCTVGVESTIVDLTGTSPRLLRPGMITAAQLEAALGAPMETPDLVQGIGESEAPGTLESHYAPSAPVTVLSASELAARIVEDWTQELRPAVLSFGQPPRDWPATHWITAPPTPDVCARHLYASLRALDDAAPPMILVESVPSTDAWRAIADRLRRASAPRPADG